MDLNFCSTCDNLMDLYSNEEEKQLYLGCKACGTNKVYNKSQCIYSNESSINLSDIINQNQYLKHDITLPSITDNVNIQCPNQVCPSNTKKDVVSELNYIKYDSNLLSFMYICKHCNQKWTNR